MTRYLILALLLMLLSVAGARAEIYNYVDESGTLHFVDNPSKIPKKLQKKKRIVDAEPSPDAVPNATKVRLVGNQVLIPATLHHNGNTVEGTFLLDTGATTTTISDVLARRLGITGETGKLVVGQVVGGALLTVRRVRLDRMDVGPKSDMDVEVDIIRHDGPPVEFDGLLGMNYLRNYHYIIDFKSQLIRWE